MLRVLPHVIVEPRPLVPRLVIFHGNLAISCKVYVGRLNVLFLTFQPVFGKTVDYMKSCVKIFT